LEKPEVLPGIFIMIKLSDLSINLGDFSLSKINLEIPQGEFFTIIGPTGSGKTVILEIIAGLYKPDSGKVFLRGTDVENVPPEKRKTGFVYQDYALFPHLNVYKNISFGLHLKKVETGKIKKTVMNMAEMLGIKHLLKRYPGTLSGGERQRVALARALVLKPDILLLDEPFSALDPNTKKSFWQELKKIHTDSGCTVVHVTHDFEEACCLAGRIGLILNGKLKQVGKPDNIFNKPKNEEIARFLDIKKNNIAGLCHEARTD